MMKVILLLYSTKCKLWRLLCTDLLFFRGVQRQERQGYPSLECFISQPMLLHKIFATQRFEIYASNKVMNRERTKYITIKAIENPYMGLLDGVDEYKYDTKNCDYELKNLKTRKVLHNDR